MTWQQSFYKETDDGKEIEILVTFELVNNGIGPYEYWGAKGNDVRMETECVEAKLKDGKDYEATNKEIAEWLEGAEVPERDDGPEFEKYEDELREREERPYS